MRRMRSGCCARAASGHATAPPSSVKNLRRFSRSNCMCFPRQPGKDGRIPISRRPVIRPPSGKPDCWCSAREQKLGEGLRELPLVGNAGAAARRAKPQGWSRQSR